MGLRLIQCDQAVDIREIECEDGTFITFEQLPLGDYFQDIVNIKMNDH